MTRFTLLALFSWIAALTLVVEPNASAAEQLRLQRASSRDTSRRTVKSHQRTQPGQQTEVRMEGTIQYDQRRGLTMNGVPIMIDRVTALSSERFTEFPSARRLDGTKATLFGRATHRGIRATLIMDRTHDSIRVRVRRSVPDPYTRPSANDPRVGTYIEGAPR